MKQPKSKPKSGKTINIDENLHQRIRIAAARMGVKLKDFVELALKALLK